MKIVSIIGTRPQFIKAAVLSEMLRRQNREVLIHTGQHYDDNMSKIFFDELGLPEPDEYLGIGGGSHAEQTGGMMLGLEKILLREKPDWCLVYGDTNSTLAGALTASKLHIPLAHVEAGLRSFNKTMPEEINRITCDHISDLLFCPTRTSAALLEREGIQSGIHVVGDVMADVLFRSLPHSNEKSRILHKLNLRSKSYLLATLHRAENTDRLENLIKVLDIFEKSGWKVVFPMHPRTQKVVRSENVKIPANVQVIEPVGYFDNIQLQSNAEAVLTDSGGMQKEAFWLGVRCITMRNETEWVETVQAGWNRVVGINQELILDALYNWRPMGDRPDVYGDGHAANKISGILQSH